MDYKEEVELAYDILKQVLISPCGMYTKDPDLYDKVQQALETIEYKLFSKD
jgi:hypothetical protein